MPKYDVIVIGGGHNGLTHAAYLARAGRRVLVLERRHVLGGAAVTEEVFPGFHISVCSYVVSLLRPQIIRDLDLPRHGFEVLPLDGTFTPMPDGNYLWRVNDHGRTRREILRHSRVDAEAYDEYGKAMIDMARFVKPTLDVRAPDPLSFSPPDLLALFRLGRRFQSMTAESRYRLVQLMTMSAADFLDQWFETDVLKATMSASGIIGTFQGVRSPGTAYVLLHHYMGEIDGAFRSWGFAKGGTGAISNAIAAAAREAGVEIRTKAAVSRILTRNGRAMGVVLDNGDEIESSIVSSSVDPRLTFTKFLDPRELPGEFVDEVRRYKFRGSSGKVNLALDGLPNFTSLPGEGRHLRGAISISPSIEYMERAYDAAKYGRYSDRPYMDVVIPSLTDPSVAPPGKHVMSCFVQYAPYHLNGTTWDDERERFGDTVINTLAEHAPNLKSLILHRQVITPLDLEREWGLSEGNIFQGELALEQLLFLRPVPGWAKYRTPIRNLYMCGSATHPGGGIMGAPGRNAALEILEMTDVIFVGGGHNGLAAAAVLARRGMKTLVLEARPHVGGAAITEELHPGFRISTLAHAAQPAAALMTELRLADHGLELIDPDPYLFAPLPDGRSLLLGARRRCNRQQHRGVLRRRCAPLSRVLRHSRRMRALIGDVMATHAAGHRAAVERRCVVDADDGPPVPRPWKERCLSAAAMGADVGRRFRVGVVRVGAAARSHRVRRYLRHRVRAAIGRQRGGAVDADVLGRRPPAARARRPGIADVGARLGGPRGRRRDPHERRSPAHPREGRPRDRRHAWPPARSSRRRWSSRMPILGGRSSG